MSANFDAIVIGGGPAGSAAALTCRQHGLRTLVVEADASPRERPGETLHPGIESIFRKLGVFTQVEAAGFLRHTGHYVHRNAQTVFQPYGSDRRGQWSGFQATRSELDCILLKQASATGAEVRRPMRALDLLVEGGRLAGVRTSGGEFRASWLVDAAGPGHWVQRQLGLPLLQVSDPLIARFGWSTRDHTATGTPEFHVLGCGWRWEAQVQTGRRAWVSLELNQPAKTQAAHARDVTWRMVRPCAGRGYFLAGDAAYVLDPASSHGVLKALMSGMLAANAISEIMQKHVDERAVCASYRAWMENWFCSDAMALVKLYSEFVPAPAWLASATEALRYISMNPFF